MKQRFRVPRIAILLICLPASVWAQDSRDLAVGIELVGDSPLPYQAVCIRAKLTNRAASRFESQYWPTFEFDRFARPNERERKPLNASYLAENPNFRGLKFEGGRSFYMDQHESLTTSGTYVAEQSENVTMPERDLVRVGLRPLFRAEGEYVLRFTCPFVAVSPSLKIHVTSPSNDDQRVVQSLMLSPNAMETIMSMSALPDPESFDLLKAIVQRFPKSSYANYARFALARAYYAVPSKASGKSTTDDEHARDICALASDWLADMTTEDVWLLERRRRGIPDPSSEELARKLFNLCFDHPGMPSGRRWDATKRLVLATLLKDDARQIAAAHEMLKLRRAAPSDHQIAKEYLTAIESKGFAYRPHALVLLHSLITPDDTELRMGVERELNERWYDNLEWLCVRETKVRNDADWRAFRVRKAPAQEGVRDSR